MVGVKTRVVVLGSTGSIGSQALGIIAEHPDLFELVGISAQGARPDKLLEQARQFGLDPSHIAVASDIAADMLERELDGRVIRGTDSARRLAESAEEWGCDVVLNALVGSLGLDATLATLQGSCRLALANKESLVAGGELVLETADIDQLIPVDSEHSAIAQCLRAGSRAEVASLVLTSSGGPFRGWTRAQLEPVTPLQAAHHPSWSMGQMNSLNVSTMVNKGLEVIEASLLFGVPASRIEVTVHPESVVHSMVTFTDGATIAQAAPPSMKLPISVALAWPHRVPGVQPPLSFAGVSSWTFEPLDDEVFPAVRIARDAAEAGGCMPAVYNAANEEAAVEFLAGALPFPRIVDTVAAVLDDCSRFTTRPRDLDDVLDAERAARAAAHERMAQWTTH